jgi:predicted RNA-binding protein
LAVYILTASDGIDQFGDNVCAKRISQDRLEAGLWPMYKRTGHRKVIKPGDTFFIYLAGSKEGAQRIVALAQAKEMLHNPKISDSIRISLYPEQPIESVISLERIQNFITGVDIRGLLDKLSFIPVNKGKWGAAFQGGCRKISQKDYEIIKNLSELSRQ